MNRYLPYILLLVLICLSSPSVQAQTNQTQNNQPIEITADGSLKWMRDDQKFIARQNALAQQGNVSIAAEEMTALYRDSKETNFDIHTMTATDNVVIRTRDSIAYGQDVIYNIDQELAVMTGDNLSISTPDQNLTATDRFEYYVVQGKLIAYGDAKITRPKPGGGTDTLEAEKITAIFTENAQGERVLKQMEALEDVVITTPTEIISGEYGVYRANLNKAELTGGVTIRRGPNILEGERAEVDLNTNTSTLFGGDRLNEGRVRGVFYPGSEDEENE